MKTDTKKVEEFAKYLKSLSRHVYSCGLKSSAVDINTAALIIEELLDKMVYYDIPLKDLEFETLLPL